MARALRVIRFLGRAHDIAVGARSRGPRQRLRRQTSHIAEPRRLAAGAETALQQPYVEKLPMDVQLEIIARQLEQSPDFKVLRRLQPRDVFSQSSCERQLTGIIIDTETTGLGLDKAEVIELAMLKFLYSPAGEVLRVIGRFSELQQPANPIPIEISRLTGIWDETVAGCAIDPAAVEAFLADAAVVIAHNARFDSPIVQKAWPFFRNYDWACSLDEIPWQENGFEGAKLAYLLMGAGLFADAHRAIGDCQALLHLLSLPFGAEGKPALATLLAHARQTTVRIFAVNSPYDCKDLLKARGYRWSNGSNGLRRCWWREVAEGDFEAEISFLRDRVYLSPVDLPTQRITARERYSISAPS
jgi:DNA polymerase-3 subunit epsilon